MNTTLDPQFLQAALTMHAFKPGKMLAAEAVLLRIALDGGEFTACELPDEITQGSKHIAGAATGALISMGLLEVTRRVKSPDPRAKGRKLDVLRLKDGKRGTVLAWFRAHDLPTEQQALLAI